MKTLTLFALTALVEIAGCYLSHLWLEKRVPAWTLLPAAACLGAFAWLLSLHPTAAGRVYAAYGGVYVAAAIVWLWAVEGVRPAASDWLGAAISLAGMAIIMLGPRYSGPA